MRLPYSLLAPLLMAATALPELPDPDWAVLPPPMPTLASANSPDWSVLPFPDWSILADAAPPKPSSPSVAPSAAPTKRCSADCPCAPCDCGAECYCCGGYATLEADALKSGKSAIVYIGTRPEDADAARREAKARGMLFLAAKSLSGIGIDGKAEKFPEGTHELRPIGGSLFFVPRETRRIPIPDKRETSAGTRWLTPAECVGAS